MEKKFNTWNGVVEKANSVLKPIRRSVCHFIGARTKGRKGGVEALRMTQVYLLV